MRDDAKIDNKTETEKIKIAHKLQKDGMPSKVAAKLAGIKQNSLTIVKKHSPKSNSHE